MVDTISSNIIYLGRPCHYATAHDLKSGCDRKYWTTHRFASDVIRAYDDILDDISQQYPNMKYNLIGFSGGANIAGLLSAKRDDIASLRTVAGNVDNDFFTRHHKVSDMPYSLNMANYVENLSNIPQMHFTAQNDKFVPVNVYNNYQSRLPNTSCTQSETIKGTKHLDGWRERWNRLLRRTPFCK
jgi:predicted peptidase